MNTNTAFQLLAAGLFALGLLALTLDAMALDGFGINADDAFATGVILTSVGVVLLADLRRRARGNGSA